LPVLWACDCLKIALAISGSDNVTTRPKSKPAKTVWRILIHLSLFISLFLSNNLSFTTKTLDCIEHFCVLWFVNIHIAQTQRGGRILRQFEYAHNLLLCYSTKPLRDVARVVYRPRLSAKPRASSLVNQLSLSSDEAVPDRQTPVAKE